MNIKQNYKKVGRTLSALSGSVKIPLLSILALTAIGIAATCLRADPGHNQLAGTWVGNAGSTLAPALVSLMADGRVIFSRPVTVQTGPATFELVSAGHGEWIPNGDHEAVSTVVAFRSGQSVEFTGMVKLVLTINLNRTTDQLAVNGTAYIYDADGNLLISLPQPGTGIFKRIVAGQ